MPGFGAFADAGGASAEAATGRDNEPMNDTSGGEPYLTPPLTPFTPLVHIPINYKRIILQL